MKRGPFAVFTSIFQSSKQLLRVFVRQRLTLSLGIVFALLLLSLFFAFIAFAPVLSPFVYPLF